MRRIAAVRRFEARHAKACCKAYQVFHLVPALSAMHNNIRGHCVPGELLVHVAGLQPVS
jgi:hypothetical protein